MADRMMQEEIDEISDAFSEAWEEFFGTEMFIVPFDDSVVPHRVYGESKGKKYKEDAKVSFRGSFRQIPIEEYGEVGGNRNRQFGEITIVTKDLRDNGVNYVDMRDRLDVPDRDGLVISFNIIGKSGKVQLVDNYIFTKLRVVREL